MILALRQRHRRMFGALGVLLPVALIIGVAARQVTPTAEGLSPELSPKTQTFTATDYERDDLFARSRVKVRLWQDLKTGQYAVGLAAPNDFIKPDLLVYWLAGRPNVSDELPAGATFLGAFVTTVLPLPDEAPNKEGVLILYSLADQEIVDVSEPFVATNASSRQIPPSRTSSENSRRLTSAATSK
ncbi:MAG TPA: hypothetical protein VFZ59_17630 [Verrucomicrobiae bacterium]|nr:hypothetical protein [Verrucomicrobiae bacterium]